MTTFSQTTAEQGYDRIYILGGDGSVNEVVKGVAEFKKRPTIGVIPTGTVNNFSHMLNISIDPWQAVDKIVDAHVKKIDIGRINDQYFVSTVLAGSLVESVKGASSDLIAHLGSLAYLIKVIQALRNEGTKKFNLALDEETLTGAYSLFLVAVGNSVPGIESFFQGPALMMAF